MHNVMKTARNTKKFAHKHRVAIAVTITAALAVKWHINTQRYNREFLEAHGLYDTYLATFCEME